uniref:KAT8 regulatory NSL complex subunit 3 n=1 Tax=Globodera rostochiensis TaxID=31243 RepID=A0A914HZ06_GLORO
MLDLLYHRVFRSHVNQHTGCTSFGFKLLLFILIITGWRQIKRRKTRIVESQSHESNTRRRPGQMQSNCIYLNSRSPSISSDISFMDDDVNSSFFCDFESDVADADEISQITLREQLNQLRTEDFILQAHFKFATGTLDQQHNNLPSVAYCGDKYFDNFLDEQEEIKLMESPSLVEIPGIATPSYSLVSSPKLGSTEIEISDATNLMESTSPFSQQKEKKQNDSLASDKKRSRRPTMKSDDFVYIPLTKSRMTNSVTGSKIVPKKEKHDENADVEDVSTLSQQKEKTQNASSASDKSIEQRKFEGLPPLTNISALKRRGRPTLKSGDFVYIPLTKSRMPNSVTDYSKVVAKKKRRTKNALIISARSAELNNTEIEMLDGAPILPMEVAASSSQQRENEIIQKESSKSQQRKLVARPSIAKNAVLKRRGRPSLKSNAFIHNSPLTKARITNSVISAKRLELIRRMTQLRHLNPMASALRGACLYEGDYFYRELLVGRSDPCTISEELEIDCVTVHAPGGFDELFVTNPAESCANSINKILLGKRASLNWVHNQEGEDADYPESLNLDEEVRAYLHIFLQFIDNQRLVDLATQGVAGGASMFHSLTMKNANRLRESLRLYSKSCQLLIVEVHDWLLKNLSQTRLISYLNLLRFLKNAGSNLGDYIITSSSEESELERANKCISEFLAQKLYEPPLSSSSKLIECDPIKNVSLVLVYPQINTKTSQHTIRAHETIFRNLLPLAVCCVEKIELNLNVDRPISVEECTWMCVRMIRQRVKEIAKRRQNDHIFLAGWGTACWLNHKAVGKISNVSGILDFAFPTESPCGSRGSVDDQICLTYPATLFVVGEDAHNVRMQALKQLRRNMIADSGLIVIGSANHNMLVSPTVLSIERVSQFIIQKNIVEYVMQFIKQVVTDLGPPKECRQFLKPIKLPDIYEVDPAFFKAKPTTGPQRPRKPAEKKEKDENEDKLRNERKTSGLSQKAPFRHPTQAAVNLPAQLQPAIPTASSKYGTHLYSARHTFNTSLKKTLNRQIPPLLQGKRMPMPSSSSAFQETLREEEEAACGTRSIEVTDEGIDDQF